MYPPATLRLRDALELARVRAASDVHVQPGSPPVLRIDGRLEALAERPFDAEEVETVATECLSEAERATLARDGDVSSAWPGAGLGALRAHVYRAGAGYAVAVRLLDRTIPTLDELQMPQPVANFADLERGLVLVGGSTGSGKSTTLAAMVDRINASRACRIVTLEDPIEYRHENRRALVTQREIGRDAATLARALVGALRADPDVIVVGELREAQEMRVALTAAETGHLVLATVHTGDAPQTIDRIVDAFAGAAAVQVRMQLAAVLAGVLCQVLVRRSGGKGRRAAVEILAATDAVRSLIRDEKTHQLRNVMATGKRYGMQTLEQHIEELVRNGEIAAEHAS